MAFASRPPQSGLARSSRRHPRFPLASRGSLIPQERAPWSRVESRPTCPDACAGRLSHRPKSVLDQSSPSGTSGAQASRTRPGSALRNDRCPLRNSRRRRMPSSPTPGTLSRRGGRPEPKSRTVSRTISPATRNLTMPAGCPNGCEHWPGPPAPRDRARSRWRGTGEEIPPGCRSSPRHPRAARSRSRTAGSPPPAPDAPAPEGEADRRSCGSRPRRWTAGPTPRHEPDWC
jgi:hypothetical protein